MYGGLNLEGQLAVIIGADTALGLAASRELARANARVVLVSDDAHIVMERAVQLSTETSTPVESFPVDVTTDAGIAALENFIHLRHGQVDIMINGLHHFGGESADALAVGDFEWLTSFTVNVLTPYRLIRTFGERMRAGRGGSIVQVLGGTGFALSTTNLPLAAMNAALWNMTRALAVEMAPFVRVNAVCAGARFDTISGQDFFGRDVDDIGLSVAPPGREGGPEEVAAAIMYLAADAASSTTGTLLTVGGKQA
jgi:NAD(P)-dependent dehydrogenase (short-subunit alcohol dehydrogenase family)